jgi:hypothetical protein
MSYRQQFLDFAEIESFPDPFLISLVWGLFALSGQNPQTLRQTAVVVSAFRTMAKLWRKPGCPAST